jgi:hypothetical protein
MVIDGILSSQALALSFLSITGLSVNNHCLNKSKMKLTVTETPPKTPMKLIDVKAET